MRSRGGSRLAVSLAIASLPALVLASACSTDNGPAIGAVVYDASPLDANQGPGDHDGNVSDLDAADAYVAPVDAGADVVTVPVIAINEVYVDNKFLRGDQTEYVELRAAAGTPLDGVRIRILNADGTVHYEGDVASPGEKVSANGLWVVGGQQTFKLNVQEHVDHALVAATGFGLDDRGAVQLLRGTMLVDVVGYGPDADAGAIPAPASPPTATSEGKPAKSAVQAAATTDPARSIGRKAGAADTNVNAADFCAMEASPGFVQKPCL